MPCKTNLDLAKSEGEAMRQQKTIKWLILVIALLILCLVGTNAFWIYKNNQYTTETTSQTVEQVADNGTNNFVGGDLVGNAENNDNNN